MEDLEVLKVAIEKIVNLGKELAKATEDLSEISVLKNKLKRKLNGVNLAKRKQELDLN